MAIYFGYDASGRGNNWTVNNLSSTAGAGNDSLTDTPTSYGTDTGVGGTVRGNYATLNPINATSAAGTSISNGNLQINGIGSGNLNQWLGTMGVSSGKWYYEVTMGENNGVVGISQTGNPNTYPGGDATSYGYSTGTKYNNNTSASYGATLTGGDVVGVAYDLDAGTITFYKNGVSQGQAYSGLSGNYFPAVRAGTTGAAVSVNFGQRAFAYTAPSGFKALCTQNLPTPTIGATSTTQANDYMNVVLYTGNGSSQSITGVGFQPDFTWIKSRSGADNHNLFNAVVGLPNRLFSNLTNAENTTAGTLTSFNSDGFSIGSISDVNANGVTFVGWNWNAGGSTVTNTSGTISAQVRASTTAGFSIATYTGNGSAGATVGHGLGVTPSMIFVKSRSVGTAGWVVWHTSLTLGANSYLVLEGTQAQQTTNQPWNNTLPTSSVFSLRTWDAVNQNGSTYVAYLFAAVAGYSAFGSYTGNGSTDGPFVYTGFRPRFILFKQSSASGNDWYIYDAVRSTYNVATNRLFPNSSAAEATNFNTLDILSNGWKVRDSNSAWNASGATYIYAAFAESPFKYALAR